MTLQREALEIITKYWPIALFWGISFGIAKDYAKYIKQPHFIGVEFKPIVGAIFIFLGGPLSFILALVCKTDYINIRNAGFRKGNRPSFSVKIE